MHVIVLLGTWTPTEEIVMEVEITCWRFHEWQYGHNKSPFP